MGYGDSGPCAWCSSAWSSSWAEVDGGVLAVILLVLAAAVVVGLPLASWYRFEEAPLATSERVTMELEGATEVSVEIKAGAGTWLSGDLTDSRNLMEAELRYDGRSPGPHLHYNVSQAGKGHP